MSTKKPNKANGKEPRRKTRRSCPKKAMVQKLTAKLAEKKARTELMKNAQNKMMDKLAELESECAIMREEYKLAIEENVDLQLSVDYVLFAFLRGGDSRS